MATTVSHPRRDQRASERGQMLIIAAGAMVVLLGFMGLVVDIGWGMFKKRVTQNAADAAALAGARAIATIGTCTQGGLAGAVDGAIAEFVADNAGNGATYSWDLRDNQGNALAGSNWCTQATTVQVQVTNGYSTFFLNILGLSAGSTNALAQARVGLLPGLGTSSPIVACGITLVRVDNETTVNVFIAGTPPTINPAYIGVDFHLHGNNVGHNGGDCGLGNDMKGTAEDVQNCPSLPCPYDVHSGNLSGPVRVKVAGALPGCDLTDAGNEQELDNCVLVVPLADAKVDSDTVHVVTYAAFYMHRTAPNARTGTLLGTVFTTGSTTNWTPNSTGVLVLSLVR